VWVLLIPAALFVRRTPRGEMDNPTPPPAADAVARAALHAVHRVAATSSLLRHPCRAIFHTISYAMVCGISSIAAVSIYSLEGLAGWAAGSPSAWRRSLRRPARADGRLLVQALAAGSFMFAQRLGEFYAVARVRLPPTAGVMPLYAVLARDYFGQQIMGTVLGAAAMVSSLGMAIGPWIGGWLFDRFGSYAPMYILLIRHRPRRRAIAFAFPPPLTRPPSFSLRKIAMNPAPGFKKRPDHRIVTKPAGQRVQSSSTAS